MDKKIIKSNLAEVTMSNEAGKMIIRGCVAMIDEPSTGAPCGADGRRVVFTKESVEKCASTFEGMPLNCSVPDDWFGSFSDLFTAHSDNKIGYLRSVEAVDDRLMADIVIWKHGNEELNFMICNAVNSLGFSLEWFPTKTHIDEEKNIEYMDEFEGCGCALLFSDVGAFSQTFIEKLSAMADKKNNRSEKEMTKEEMQSLVDVVSEKVSASIDEKIEGQKIAIEAMAEQIKSIGEALKAMQERADEPTQASTEVEERVQDIPQPTAVQASVANPLNGKDDYEAQIAKINASSVDPMEKLKQITKLRKAQKA